MEPSHSFDDLRAELEQERLKLKGAQDELRRAREIAERRKKQRELEQVISQEEAALRAAMTERLAREEQALRRAIRETISLEETKLRAELKLRLAEEEYKLRSRLTESADAKPVAVPQVTPLPALGGDSGPVESTEISNSESGKAAVQDSGSIVVKSEQQTVQVAIASPPPPPVVTRSDSDSGDGDWLRRSRFLDLMPRQLTYLEEAWYERNDVEFDRICRWIASHSKTLGFSAIGEVAEKIQELDLDTQKSQVNFQLRYLESIFDNASLPARHILRSSALRPEDSDDFRINIPVLEAIVALRREQEKEKSEPPILFNEPEEDPALLSDDPELR